MWCIWMEWWLTNDEFEIWHKKVGVYYLESISLKSNYGFREIQSLIEVIYREAS